MPSAQFVESDLDLRLRMDAASFADYPKLTDLTPLRLRILTEELGVDFATVVLFDRVVRASRHRTFVARIDALRSEPPAESLGGMTFAVAPGAFYREFPHVGADGSLLREVAASFGCKTAVVPVASSAGLRNNAEVILNWLEQQSGSPIILASLSKGTADVRVALQDPRADWAFRNVVAWVSLCGMHNGTPLVDALLSQKLRTQFVKLLFWWRGLSFQMVRDLRPGPHGLFGTPFELPSHIRLVNVVGFPLRSHMTNQRSRRWRRALDVLGPNDGGVLLGDVCQLPGDLYPIWGADHYLCPRRFDMRSLATAILHDLSCSFQKQQEPPRNRLVPQAELS